MIISIIIKDLIRKIGILRIKVVKVATLKFFKKKRYTILNKTITHYIKGFVNKGVTLRVIKL